MSADVWRPWLFVYVRLIIHLDTIHPFDQKERNPELTWMNPTVGAHLDTAVIGLKAIIFISNSRLDFFKSVKNHPKKKTRNPLLTFPFPPLSLQSLLCYYYFFCMMSSSDSSVVDPQLIISHKFPEVCSICFLFPCLFKILESCLPLNSNWIWVCSDEFYCSNFFCGWFCLAVFVMPERPLSGF